MFEKLKAKIKMRLGVPSLEWSLTNLKRNGFNPSIISDIGAYEGKWTEEVLEIFPLARYYLFEAQKSKERILKKQSSQHHNVFYSIGLLGAEDGKEIAFNEYETASSVLSEHFSTEASVTKKKLQTFDSVLRENKWPYPDFIKIDTQGYELEILKGATGALINAEVVLLEVSFIDVYKNMPLVKEVIDFMEAKGFQVYDICSLLLRPYDKALFQSDIIFVKQSSALVSSKRWG